MIEADSFVASTSYSPDVAPCFYSWRDMYPELSILQQNIDIIKAEAAAIGQVQNVASCPHLQQYHINSAFNYAYVIQWVPWPEDHFTLGNDVDNTKEWTVFPLMHTFPAYDPDRTKWVASTCAHCPKTVAFLKALPNIRTALFSRLGPGTKVQELLQLATYQQ